MKNVMEEVQFRPGVYVMSRVTIKEKGTQMKFK